MAVVQGNETFGYILSDFHIKVDIELGICRIAETDMIIHVIGTVVPSFDLDLSAIIQDELSTIILELVNLITYVIPNIQHFATIQRFEKIIISP